MQIFYVPQAAKQLSGLPNTIQKRIAKKMRFYALQKNPLRFAGKLSDYREGEYRFRVGNYRIIFDVIKERLIVLKIGHRKDIYS